MNKHHKSTAAEKPAKPNIKPLVVGTAEAGRLGGWGKTKVFELIAAGELESFLDGRGAWRAGFGFGRYHAFNRANSIQERPINKGPKVGIDGDRTPWRVIAAGAAISANQYHCAIVGAAEGIAAVDRSNATHWARSGRRQS